MAELVGVALPLPLFCPNTFFSAFLAWDFSTNTTLLRSSSSLSSEGGSDEVPVVHPLHHYPPCSYNHVFFQRDAATALFSGPLQTRWTTKVLGATASLRASQYFNINFPRRYWYLQLYFHPSCPSTLSPRLKGPASSNKIGAQSSGLLRYAKS